MVIFYKVIKELLVSILILLTSTYIMFVLLGQFTYKNTTQGIQKYSFNDINDEYFSWTIYLITKGEFPNQTKSIRDVNSIISQGFSRTFSIVAGSIVVISLVFIPVGFVSGYKKLKLSKLFSTALFIISSVPVFLLSIFIRPFWVNNFGQIGLGQSNDLFLRIGYFSIPVIILSIGDGLGGEIIKHVEDSVSSIEKEKYILAASARNAKIIPHLLKNSIIPIFSILSSRITILLGGALIVEYIFFSEGITKAALQALQDKDWNVIIAIAFIFSVIIVFMNFLNKFLSIIIDPRLRS